VSLTITPNVPKTVAVERFRDEVVYSWDTWRVSGCVRNCEAVRSLMAPLDLLSPFR
jgi:hypothetical protein